ncbi:alpha/beta fold hydrolase [Streptomyces sp. NBC_00005]|uniref:alpha/beta fold hydrolase n=1 Tax=Streptomyces sp. NBC_00005 TaxID=2903609 RepID=UPI003865A700
MDTAPRTVKANGITLAYRSWGPEDAPPVLLLHSRGADGADWTPIAERLATGVHPRRVYAPDLRGHGRSDWPGAGPGHVRTQAGVIRVRDHARRHSRIPHHPRHRPHGRAWATRWAAQWPTSSPSRRRISYDGSCSRTCPPPIPLDPPRPPAERPYGDLPFD